MTYIEIEIKPTIVLYRYLISKVKLEVIALHGAILLPNGHQPVVGAVYIKQDNHSLKESVLFISFGPVIPLLKINPKALSQKIFLIHFCEDIY